MTTVYDSGNPLSVDAKHGESPAKGQRGQRKFTKTEREAVKLRVAELDKRGWTTRQIASEIGVNCSQIVRYLQSMRKELKERQTETLEEKMEYKREQLRDVLKEAMIAWEWSKGETVESLSEQIIKRVQQCSKLGLPVPTDFHLTLKFNPVSDFLRIALDAIWKEANMYGLTKEQQTTLVNQVMLDWSSLMETPENGGDNGLCEVDHKLAQVEAPLPIGLKELTNGETT